MYNRKQEGKSLRMNDGYYKGLNAQGQPTFSFPYLDETNQIPLTSTFSNSVDETSRWRIQLGVRYRFNQ